MSARDGYEPMVGRRDFAEVFGPSQREWFHMAAEETARPGGVATTAGPGADGDAGQPPNADAAGRLPRSGSASLPAAGPAGLGEVPAGPVGPLDDDVVLARLLRRPGMGVPFLSPYSGRARQWVWGRFAGRWPW